MQKRNSLVDLLRVIAIVGVIFIHVSSRSLEQGGYDLLRLSVPFFLNQLFRFAVPMFFFLSGYTLEYRYIKEFETKTFLKKRIVKLIVPYVLWSALYYVFYNKNPFINLFKSDFFDKIITGTASIHLYFIPSLILLYLLFPILHIYIRHLLKRWFIVLLTLGEIIILCIDYYSGGLPFINPIRIALLNLYIFFVGMVCVYKQKEIVYFVKKYSFFMLGGLCMFVAYILCESKGNFFRYRDIHYITSQWRASILLYTMTFVGLLMAAFQNRTYIGNTRLRNLSKLTFFVYFSHVFVISLFWRFIGSYVFSKTAGHIVENVFFNLFVFLFVASVSYAVAYIVRYVPKVRWVLGIS